MSEDYDFDDDLRGEKKAMSGRPTGSIISAIIVGVILTFAQVIIARSADDSGEKNTAEKLATLTERVSNLSDQVRKLTEQPFVRRYELDNMENRVTGLEQRVGVVERSAVARTMR
jgi:hypothetical protein